MASGRSKTFESGILGARRIAGNKSMVKAKIEGKFHKEQFFSSLFDRNSEKFTGWYM